MKCFLSMLFVLFSLMVVGQKKHAVYFVSEHGEQLERLDKKNFPHARSAQQYIEKKRYNFIRQGYLLASVDSLVIDSLMTKVYFYKGPSFSKIKVTVSDDDRYLIKKVPRVSEKFLQKVPFNPREIELLLKGIADYLHRNGFPFATVKLDVADLSPETTTARLTVFRGPEVKFSKIHLKGEAQVSEKFLTNLIAIREGDYYDEEKLRKIANRILQIQFLEEIKPHELLFTPEGAELFLYLKSSPVSLVNGVVGLQPNPITGQNVITGDVRLKLLNVLKRGELLDVNWRSLQPQTQDLKLKLNYPFLFNTPFGIDASFDLYRRDSTFLTTTTNLGVQYFLKGGNYIKAFFEAENSNLLQGGINNPSGNMSSVANTRYGVGVFRRQLDYLPNPSKGFYLELDGLIGSRSSRRPTEDTATVTTTYSLRLNLDWYLPLAKRHVLRVANTTRAYYAPEIFTNELFRFGGLTTQRGFDEEELWGSTRSTFTVEYRFLVDRNSHAFLFYDQSFYENNAETYYRDQPFGVGAGFSFGTNLGIFSITYGVGRQLDNPMLLRNGKVHFGYVSFF
jgi:outer membrane protein assembly factor BamA